MNSTKLAFIGGLVGGSRQSQLGVWDRPVCELRAPRRPRWIMLIGHGSVPNFRDVASADPERVRPNRAYRMACPVDATTEDAAAMSGIRTLIDLRSDTERKYETGERSEFLRLFRTDAASGPSQPPRSKNAQRAWITVPLLSRLLVAWQVFRRTTLKQRFYLVFLAFTLRFRAFMNILRDVLDDGGLPLVNEIMLQSSKQQICTVFETMAQDGSQPVGIFCTAGKDRTGLIVALLLSVLGVSQERIVADYVRSEEMYLANPDQRTKQMKLLAKAGLNPERWIGNPPVVIEHVLGIIHRQYGSIEAFLESAGVSVRTLTRLREKMLL